MKEATVASSNGVTPDEAGVRRTAREQIAAVKARRGPNTPEMQERNKENSRAQRAVLSAIATEAKTPPEIAGETGLDAGFVVWLLAGLRKYNKAEAVRKRGDYMTYRKKGGS